MWTMDYQTERWLLSDFLSGFHSCPAQWLAPSGYHSNATHHRSDPPHTHTWGGVISMNMNYDPVNLSTPLRQTDRCTCLRKVGNIPVFLYKYIVDHIVMVTLTLSRWYFSLDHGKNVFLPATSRTRVHLFSAHLSTNECSCTNQNQSNYQKEFGWCTTNVVSVTTT